MIDSIQELEKKIKDLINYINKNKRTKVFINEVQKEKSPFQQYALWLEFNNLDVRIFEYNSYIISLYGCFEKFIESILAEYIDNICSLHSKFNELPSEIISNNIKKNAELLNVLDYPKNKGVNEQLLIKNLHNNMSQKSPIINTTAFCQHTSNFRINSINDYFKFVGVNSLGKSIAEYEPITSKLDEIHDNYKSLELSKVYSIINDLADRRNIIAHGGDHIDILDSDEILKMCSFINDFCKSLNSFLKNSIFARIAESDNKHLKYNKHQLTPIKVCGKNVLCINSNNLNISIGSKILIEGNNTPKFTLANIEDIQVDGNSKTNIASDVSIDIGLKLNSKIKHNNKFYLLEN